MQHLAIGMTPRTLWVSHAVGRYRIAADAMRSAAVSAWIASHPRRGGQ